jgi:hypothetical protein
MRRCVGKRPGRASARKRSGGVRGVNLLSLTLAWKFMSPLTSESDESKRKRPPPEEKISSRLSFFLKEKPGRRSNWLAVN